MDNPRIFSDVHLEAEQVTEIHRTLENDHTVTETELPGLVNVYLVIDGGRILLDQLKAPVVLEAIDKAGEQQRQQQAQQQPVEPAAETPPPAAEPQPDPQPQG